jgi:hypothetical protein
MYSPKWLEPFHPSSKTNDSHSLLKCIHPNGFYTFHPSSKTSCCHSLLKCIHPKSWTLSSIFKDKLLSLSLVKSIRPNGPTIDLQVLRALCVTFSNNWRAFSPSSEIHTCLKLSSMLENFIHVGLDY